MLDYPTCLKLKEAGFPQKRVPPTGRRQADGADIWFVDGYAVTEMPASEPTLEELIEFVGEIVLWKSEGLWRVLCPEGEYITPDTVDAGYGTPVSSGESPEEAVANLYLLLNPIK